MKWDTKTLRAAGDVHELTADYRVRGWRLTHVAACADAKGRRLLTVAAENPTRLDWDYRIDLTKVDYERALADQDRLGLRPVSVASYVLNNEVRYAAVWERYRLE